MIAISMSPTERLALVGLLTVGVLAALVLIDEWRRHRARTTRQRALAAANSGSRRRRWTGRHWRRR